MSSADVARRYFEALAARDVKSAVAFWSPGGIERLVGQRELTAPEGVRELQEELLGAFPDLVWEILDVIGAEGGGDGDGGGGGDGDRAGNGAGRAAVRWRATGTFAGPGTFQGFVANGAHLQMEGCDVL
ncbi:MAG TPA: nuclear transport factor 2 family protein, partial [Solirubrobacteraceae bacterium]